MTSRDGAAAHRGDSHSFEPPAGEVKPCVLVVDDGAEARDLYCECLAYDGFSAEAAEDGPAGLAMAIAVRPDLIVLDYSMPRMDGGEVLRRLKSDDRTRTIPVVMLTAMPELVLDSVKTDCAAFLEKPCQPDRLVQTISGILAAPSCGPVGARGKKT